MEQNHKILHKKISLLVKNQTITLSQNSLPDVTPTGLLIDNLPFILMIGLGLAGFVVLSKKQTSLGKWFDLWKSSVRNQKEFF